MATATVMVKRRMIRTEVLRSRTISTTKTLLLLLLLPAPVVIKKRIIKIATQDTYRHLKLVRAAADEEKKDLNERREGTVTTILMPIRTPPRIQNLPQTRTMSEAIVVVAVRAIVIVIVSSVVDQEQDDRGITKSISITVVNRDRQLRGQAMFDRLQLKGSLKLSVVVAVLDPIVLKVDDVTAHLPSLALLRPLMHTPPMAVTVNQTSIAEIRWQPTMRISTLRHIPVRRAKNVRCAVACGMVLDVHNNSLRLLLPNM